ncbi:MAG: class I SAM-dependent methyltransferase [Candidatus Methylomirabilales bacterium]
MKYRWHEIISHRDYNPDHDLTDPHEGLSPALLQLIREEASSQRRVIEVGCGSGRLTLAIASLFQEIIALDWSASALAEAQTATAAHGMTNVHLHPADAERVDYQAVAGEPIHMVVAHLCMSNAIIVQAARLGPETVLAFAAFHTDQWRETGIISRFAYSESAMEEALDGANFHPCYLGLEKEILHFPSPDVAVAYGERTSLQAKWGSSPRWSGFLKYVQEGGHSLTVRARVVVKARRI